VELDRRRWNDIIKLAAIVSIIAVLVALLVSTAGDVPQAAIVLPVIVVAFAVSWIQTGRNRTDTTIARPSTLRGHLIRHDAVQHGSLRHS